MSFVSPFNIVSKRNNEHTLETLKNVTNDGNQTEEIATSFSVAVDARMSVTMDEWFRRLQKTSKNKLSSVLQSSALPNKPHTPPHTSHVPPSELNAPVFPSQTASAHLSNHFLHPRPIMLPTPRFIFCHLILTGHHSFCRQICMSCHPLTRAIILMLKSSNSLNI